MHTIFPAGESAPMTMLDRENVRCGNCGASSDHSVLMSTNAFGSPDLDLRPPEMHRSTMNTWLQLCPSCGYCAPDLTQTPSDKAVLQSEAYHAALRAEGFPKLARRFLAFAVATGQSDPATTARGYLQAAWVCDDYGRHEQADECRRQAAAWLSRCKPFPGDETGSGMMAVLVDVLRRSGQFAEASAECRAGLASPATTSAIREVLEYQQQLIECQDTKAHMLPEDE
jgi:hypothetical protein